MGAKDYYNTGHDATESIYGVRWFGQTFTPSKSYKLKKIKLKGYVTTQAAGDLIVELYATSGGLPTDSPLASGTFDGLSLPYIGTKWFEVNLYPKIRLSAGIMYAIVFYATDRTVDNRFYWYTDSSSPTYSGGTVVYSTNSGDSWATSVIRDGMFEIWGPSSKSGGRMRDWWGW